MLRYNTINSLLLTSIIYALLFFPACGTPRINSKEIKAIEENNIPMIPTTYKIGQGDQLEILYHINPDFSIAEYIIEIEDTLRVDFFYYPVLSKTVRVRPDGFITLPRVGEVEAAGQKPTDLAGKIEGIYREHLRKPTVTVDVIGFNTKMEELKKAITTVQRGQSRLAVVRPDGNISLPYLKDVTAAGLTGFELSNILETEYQKFINNIGVTVAVLVAHSNRAYIMGQVKRPSFYELIGPITLTQLIANAGGFDRQANTHQIVIISRSEDGQPKARLVDMNDIIGKGDLPSDPMIQQYDVVFVPRTQIAKGSLVGESLWRMIPLSFTGTAAYSLGGTAPE